MFNHITEAKTFVMAARTLAIALLTIGLGVNSAWAGSDQPSGQQVSPLTTDVVIQPVTAAGDTRRSITMRMHAVLRGSTGPMIATHFLPQFDKSALGNDCKRNDDCGSGCCCPFESSGYCCGAIFCQ